MAMEALVGEMRRMMKTELDLIHDRLNQVENANRGRERVLLREVVFDEFDELDMEEEDNRRFRGNHRRNGRAKDDRDREDKTRADRDRDLGSIKMKVPSFQGKSDPEAYFEWETKTQFVFECQSYTDSKKVRLAAAEFTDYAIVWWDQFVTNRRRDGERPVETWEEMKAVMRKRFVPRHYYRDLYNKLQYLKQGNRSVEEYYREMEVAMIRANVQEDRESTMARFLAGLNMDIADKVELQHYVEMEDMLHMAIKVEKQLKRRGGGSVVNRVNRFPEQSSWKKNSPGVNKTDFKPKTEVKLNLFTPKTPTSATSSTFRNRDIKCLKC